MNKSISRFIFFVAEVCMIYAAFVMDVDGALNMLKFWVWFSLIGVALSFRKEDFQKLAACPPSSLVTIRIWLVGPTLLFCFIWGGHHVAAAACAMHMLVVSAIRGEVRKIRETKLAA